MRQAYTDQNRWCTRSVWCRESVLSADVVLGSSTGPQSVSLLSLVSCLSVLFAYTLSMTVVNELGRSEVSQGENVADLLKRYRANDLDRSSEPKKVFCVRLGVSDLALMELLAENYFVPKATFARDLLRAGMQEAKAGLRFSEPEERDDFWERYRFRVVDLVDEEEDQ